MIRFLLDFNVFDLSFSKFKPTTHRIRGRRHFRFIFCPTLVCLKVESDLEVTKILLALAQATHELVPPEILKDSIMTIANNFVTDRNSNEVMAVG